jgi:FkbM family methyltransferase
LPLSLIPHETAVRVLRGPLKRKKWIIGAANHACWTGTYEVNEIAAFFDSIRSGDCVYDVGANVGIYTMTASLAAGPKGNVYAFEPLERNVRYLRRHLALNHLQNCSIIEAAVSDRVGAAKFAAASRDHQMSQLSGDGELLVPSVTLDYCIYEGKELRPPNVLKIDVEGAEYLVLRGARRTLREFHPRIFVELHGTQQHSDCHEFLAAEGYQLKVKYGHITAT